MHSQEPGNYRGITLLSVVGKVFSNILIGACICSDVDLHVCVCGSAHCGCAVDGSVAMAVFIISC